MKPDNTVKVEIDQEEVYAGSMKDDWELLKPKEISDPEDKKPSDWADDAMMDDPEDKKPDDWVTEQRVVDSSAKKPDDWDDEEDGDWEAPMIDNPDYKGDWYVKRISNPAYKGVWEPKKIANPEYEDDNEVYKYADFGFIGFDLWQVKGGTIFDNILITDDKAEADTFAKKWQAPGRRAVGWQARPNFRRLTVQPVRICGPSIHACIHAHMQSCVCMRPCMHVLACM